RLPPHPTGARNRRWMTARPASRRIDEVAGTTYDSVTNLYFRRFSRSRTGGFDRPYGTVSLCLAGTIAVERASDLIMTAFRIRSTEPVHSEQPNQVGIDEQTFLRAAQAGDPQAMCNLGILLTRTGRTAEGHAWYVRAAENGS